MNRDVAGLRRLGDAEIGEDGRSVHMKNPFNFQCETRVSSETIHVGFCGGKRNSGGLRGPIGWLPVILGSFWGLNRLVRGVEPTGGGDGPPLDHRRLCFLLENTPSNIHHQAIDERPRDRRQVLDAAHADFQLALGPPVVQVHEGDLHGLRVTQRDRPTAKSQISIISCTSPKPS